MPCKYNYAGLLFYYLIFLQIPGSLEPRRQPTLKGIEKEQLWQTFWQNNIFNFVLELTIKYHDLRHI